jgi:NADH:ubiquinone oxidoreductase subunit E
MLALLVRRATAVPHPAMTTMSTTTAAMMIVHGVRCTGACGGAPAAGV